jgi:hypothetical protein
MADLFTRKAKFEQVKFDLKALEFHRDRYESGAVDKLALQCYQYLRLHEEKMKNVQK